MRFTSFLSLAALVPMLAACQTFGLGDTAGTPAVAAVAPVGGLIGQSVGRDLGVAAQQKAYDAEMEALQNGRAGTPVAWNYRGDRGEVVPGPRYNINDVECRDYTHQIWSGGQAQSARGTACQQADGTWRIVN